MHQMMGCRVEMLGWAAEGLRRTGVSLVGFSNNGYSPAGMTDDPGLYFFVPHLSRLTGIQVERCAFLFLSAIVSAAILLGIIASAGAFKTRTGKALGALAILASLTAFSYISMDVYNISPALSAILIPSGIIIYRGERRTLFLAVLAAIAGVLISSAGFIRSFAGVPALLFVAVAIAAARNSTAARKALLAAVLALSLLAPKMYYNHLVAARTNFVKSHVSNFKSIPGRHMLWHNVYIGLGWMPNKYGITYLDDVSIAKAQSVSPDVVYGSVEYETILKNAVFDIARRDPGFIARNVVFKTGYLLIALLIFANGGLVAAVFFKPDPWLCAAFALALCAGALPGIIVMPSLFVYVYSFFLTASLAGIYFIDNALDKGAFQAIKNRFGKSAPGRG